MRTTLLMTCALLAAACGGSDNRPAQDPSSAASTSSTTVTTGATPTDTDPLAAPAGDPLTGPKTSDSTGGAGPSTFGAQPQPVAPATIGNPSASSDANVMNKGANVANNPGVNDQTTNADNTKANDRDRHGTLTPMNQGNSGAETKITASIRKGLMGDKSLSFTAKNVKIITQGSKVTLRGPVNSDQEKAAIEARAKQTPGVTDVDDQIEVKK